MNSKLHSVISALISIGFLITIQLFATPQPIFRYLIPAFSGFIIVVSIYHWLWLRHLEKWNWWLWLRPAMFLSSWFLLFFIIPNSFLRGAFLLLSLLVIYLFETSIGSVGEQLLFNQILLTAVAFFMAVMAAAQYFPGVGLWYSFFVFVMMAVLVRASYEFTPLSTQHKWVSALVIALFCTELFWSLNFLPLHYSALALIWFSLFYFCWALYYYYVFKHLTRRKIQFHLVLTALFIITIVVVTPWTIIT